MAKARSRGDKRKTVSTSKKPPPVEDKTSPEESTSSAGNIPIKYFEATALIQRARDFDHRHKYARAINTYLKACRIFTTLLQKYPQLAIHKLIIQEADLGLKRIRQLQPFLHQPPSSSSKKVSTSSVSKSDQQKLEMRATILNSLIKPNPRYGWDSLVGLDQVKHEVFETLYLPFSHPELLAKNAKSSRSIFLYGPPGCGKTRFAKAIASDTRFTLFSISAAQLISKWQGESQKMVPALYETAWEKSPSVIFIDEFDGIFGRSSSRTQMTDSSQTLLQMQHELQQYMDGMFTPEENHTVTIVATNRPWKFTSAQLRRFEKLLFVGPPSPEATKELVHYYLQKTKCSLSQKEFDWLLYELQVYTPAEIQRLCIFAIYRTYYVKLGNHPSSFPRPLVLADFQTVLPKIKPRLRFTGGLRKFREFNEKYGRPQLNIPQHRYEKIGYSSREAFPNPIDLSRESSLQK